MQTLRRKQSGTALLIGLLVLVVLSLLGTTAMQQTVVQERMAGGLRNEHLAWHAGESALRNAEQFLWSWYETTNGVKLVGDANGSLGVYSAAPVNSYVQSFRGTSAWMSDGTPHTHDFTTNPTGADAAVALKNNPRYLVEELTPDGVGGAGEGAEFDGGGEYSTGGSEGELIYYRITSRATDGTGNVVRMYESTFTLSR